jgi:hypothetical protein
VVPRVSRRETNAPALCHNAPPAAAAQRGRRGALARLRNSALAFALGLEDYVFWVDSDITSMPSHTLAALVGSGKDVVTTVTKG